MDCGAKNIKIIKIIFFPFALNFTCTYLSIGKSIEKVNVLESIFTDYYHSILTF